MSTVYDEKLLDKVGLAMVPSGYTNNVADPNNEGGFLGKVYSVLPEDGGGDFDFSRGSDATRVNSQGLIESVQVLSDELVQNGDFEEIGDELATNGGFDTDSNWNGVNANGTSISNGSLNYSNTSLNHNVSQGSVVTIGKLYRLIFTISNYEKGSILPILGAGGTLQEVSGDGTYTMYGTASINTVFYFQARGTDGTTLSIDNVSVKEVGQNWGTTGTWSVANNQAKANADGSSQYIQQDFNITNGKVYKLTYEIIENTLSGNGASLSSIGGFGSVPLSSVEGYHTEYITASNQSATHSLKIGVSQTATTGSITIDNISIVEVTDDTDIPRLDYANSACPSLLLEPSRTNKILNSYNPTTGISTVDSNYETGYLAPDGTYSAVRYYVDGVKTLAYNNFGGSGILPTDARSIYAKTVSGTGTTNLTSYHDNTNSLFTITEEWQRFEVLGATTTAGQNNFYGVDFRLPESTLTEVILWAPQSEVGSYPTSYIPTNGETNGVIRLADKCNNAGDSTIFNDSEGVLFVEVACLESTSGIISLSDGTGTSDKNSVRLFFQNGQIKSQIYGSSDTTIDVSIVGTVQNILEFNKVAFKYSQNGCSLFVNGAKAGIDADSFSVSSLSTINFSRNNPDSIVFKGKVRSLLYFNEALSDAELEYITSADIDLTVHNYKGSLNKISAIYEDVGVKDRLTKLF